MNLNENITEVNELINTGVKLVCEKKNGIAQKTRRETQKPDRNFDWKRKKRNLQAKMIKQRKNVGSVETKKKQNKTRNSTLSMTN